MVGFYLAMLDSVEEKDKFEELYRLYRQDMYKVAYSILKNSADAEDAVHEAFLIILRNLNKISQTKCPQTRAYLIVIVKNLSLRLYNKGKKVILVEEDDIGLPDSTDVESQIVGKLGAEKLKCIIEMLPENYYQILFLEFYLELDLKEISNSLGISYSNAQKRSQRAKNKLKKLIEEKIDNAV